MAGRAFPRGRGAVFLLGTLFVVSGFSALLVEQVFEKLLLTVVGSATGSASIVLSVFFLGLTTGSIVYASRASRDQSPLTTLLFLELIVASSGLALSTELLPMQRWSSELIAGSELGGVALFGLRLLLSVAWMAIPTVAMGATYPVVVRILESTSFPRGSALPTWFYGLNLLGAVGAGILGPYVLFPRFGLLQTLTGGCLIQAATAVVCVLASRRLLSVLSWNEERSRWDSPSARVPRLLLWLGAFSGFLVFSLEVLWFHLIGAVLGMSTYAFAAMLIVVLLALFAVSAMVSVLPARVVHSPWALPVSLTLTGASIVWSSSHWAATPQALWDQGLGIHDFAQGESLRFRLLLTRVGLPAAAAGALFPLLLRSHRIPESARSRAVAHLGVVNALGCAGGALLTGFFLISHFGSEQTLRLLATLVSLVAVVLWWTARGPGHEGTNVKKRKLLLLSFVPCAVVIFAWAGKPWDRLALTSGIHVYFRKGHVHEESTLRYWHEDTASGFVTVVELAHGGRSTKTLLTNGKFQGNDSGEASAQVAIAALPCLANPARDRALVIGLGTGQSARVIQDAGFRHVDVVEIAPGIARAATAEFLHLNENVLQRDGVDLILEDGRNHLLRTSELYDVISMEISSIWFAGATNLYSKEFYEVARRRLKKGGVLQQWIQLHHITEREVSSVLRTVRGSFEFVELWYVGGQGIVLASDKPIQLISAEAEASLPAAFRRDLATLDEAPVMKVSFRDSRILGRDAVTQLATRQEIPINTDANRWLEFQTPLYALSTITAEGTISRLLDLVEPQVREETRHRLKLEDASK